MKTRSKLRTFPETVEQWTLSGDDKILNIDTHIKSSQGEVNLKLVLVKQ